MFCILRTYGRFKDLDQSVKDDVEFFKGNPLVLDVPISGYSVRRLGEVPDF
jgi:hypothetical protein